MRSLKKQLFKAFFSQLLLACVPCCIKFRKQMPHISVCDCGSGMLQRRCTHCKTGSSLCAAHGRRKNNCMQCVREGDVSIQKPSPRSEICVHKRARKHCAQCGGSHLCRTCRLTITRVKGVDCAACRRWKTGLSFVKGSEHEVKNVLDSEIAAEQLSPYSLHDRRANKCLDSNIFGSLRPDFIWKLPLHWVVLEVDEHQHKHYAFNCERRRELDLFNSAEGHPVILVRYNPDAFRTSMKSARQNLAQSASKKRHEQMLTTLKTAITMPAEILGNTRFAVVRMYYDCQCFPVHGQYACNFTHKDCYLDHSSFLLRWQDSLDVSTA